MDKKMNNKGFSLVELIVVIAIMAVLVGVLAPQFIKYVEKSRESTDIQNCDSIRTVVESYYSDKEGSALPSSGEVTVTITSTGTTIDHTGSKALSDAGVTNNKLKSSKWTGGKITMKYTIASGQWLYTGSADYYGLNATNDGFVVE